MIPPPAPGYDAELRRHNEVLRRACDVQPHDHVLDIGCGAGQTTRQAARAAREGSAFGIDVSEPAILRARDLAQAEGIGNVSFERADAQSHAFPRGRFDLAVSRFGTMFFADPVAAFTNIGQALRPGGRLVTLVWQAAERNEWTVVIRRSLGMAEGATDDGPNAFSLADPPTVETILKASGFTDITFTDVHEPAYYGPDVPAALGWIRGFTSASAALDRLEPAAASQAIDRLSEALSERLGDDGVWFDSRAWLVTAHRR